MAEDTVIEEEITEEETPEVPESTETNPEDESNEVVVTIGDETPPQEQAPEWVRELRKTHRETVKRVKELEAENEKLKAPKTPELGPKPKLEDFDYDGEKFEQALTQWHDKKREVDHQAEQKAEDERKQGEAWQEKLNAYGENKAKLKVKNFDEAESVAQSMFSETQQAIMIQGSDNSAMVFYALGSNPERAKEIAAITDPVKFAFAVAKLEKDLKVKNRKAPPPPEEPIEGSAPKSGTVDSTLERLRAEAEKTGDYSKVHEYKQKRKAKT